MRTVGRGPPVMLVHGFASHGGSWLPFVAPFAHRYRFLLPDLRGFGRSHHVSIHTDCVLTQFAYDLHDVLTALDIERAPVASISMGALSTVKAFELGAASRIGRYMHIDQGPIIKNRPDYAHGLMGDVQERFFSDVRALLDELEHAHFEKAWHAVPAKLRYEFWKLLGEFSQAAFSPRWVRSLLAAAATRDALMQRYLPVANWQVYMRVVRAYLDRDYDLSDGFRAIGVPLTVLIGGGSRMYPAPGQRAIAQLAPHAKVTEIARAGHMLPYEAPRAFLTELSRFLTA